MHLSYKNKVKLQCYVCPYLVTGRIAHQAMGSTLAEGFQEGLTVVVWHTSLSAVWDPWTWAGGSRFRLCAHVSIKATPLNGPITTTKRYLQRKHQPNYIVFIIKGHTCKIAKLYFATPGTSPLSTTWQCKTLLKKQWYNSKLAIFLDNFNKSM